MLVTFGIWGVATPYAGTFNHWRTIVHELGHNLGLRHCGTSRDASMCANPADYLSLMSYAHQNVRGSTVNSYSGAGDPTFNDWFNLRPDFNRAQIHLGGARQNALVRDAALAPGTIVTAGDGVNDHDPGEEQAEQASGGPLDFEKPTVDITSPNYGTSFLQGQNLPVVLTATAMSRWLRAR